MIPRLLYPFLEYRSFFLPTFIACVVVLPCWLVFRLYRLRMFGHPLSSRREILLATLVLYLVGLTTVTLLPNHSSSFRAETTVGFDLHPSVASLTCSSSMLPPGSKARAFCIRNARGNVLLFLPFGILIPLVWRRLGFRSGIQIAMSVSFSIELVQYLLRAWINRSADVNDVILNVLGASLGLALVFLVRSVFVAHPEVAGAGQ